jgi:hypothetical protein
MSLVNNTEKYTYVPQEHLNEVKRLRLEREREEMLERADKQKKERQWSNEQKVKAMYTQQPSYYVDPARSASLSEDSEFALVRILAEDRSHGIGLIEDGPSKYINYSSS